MKKERWKPAVHPKHGLVVGYEVSDYGRVRSLPRQVFYKASPGHCAHFRSRRGNLLRSWFNRISGYPYVSLARSVGHATVHSLVARTFLGPASEGQEVRHKDGDARNSRLTNLHYGTHVENLADVVFHGRRKVTVSMIRFMRARWDDGWLLTRIAAHAGVCESHAHKIVTREYYPYVE